MSTLWQGVGIMLIGIVGQIGAGKSTATDILK